MRPISRTRRTVVLGTALVVGLGLAAVAPSSAKTPSQPAAASPASDRDAGQGVAPKDRAAVLGPDWKSSDDVLVHAVGDQAGLQVMVARASDGYAFRTLATLSEPGLEADRWIGNACVTGDRRHVAVVYAPRQSTNSPVLVERGGFGAIVDLASGRVRKLGFGSTLAYYSPGCGAERSVVFSRYSGTDAGPGAGRTRLTVVDAATSKVERSVDASGQVTSAVPVGDAVVAARATSLLRISNAGKVKKLDATSSVPRRIVASGPDAVTYLEQGTKADVVNRVQNVSATPRVTELSRKKPGKVDLLDGAGEKPVVVPVDDEQVLAASADGTAVLVEKAMPRAYLDDRGKRPNPAWVAARTRAVSDDGLSTLRATLRIGPRYERDVVIRPGAQLDSTPSGAQDPSRWGPATAAAKPARSRVAAAAASTSHDTIDSASPCAVPRNDPKTQVYQPTPRQVEWAVNQAVTGNLNVERPAGWKRSGITSSWSPQGLIPRRALTGGGRVPSQILLGILAQESNLWQASGHNLPGIPGNPLIGNYYGTDVYDNDPDNDFTINWTKADCGYGVAQVTDGMQKGGSRSAKEQRAIAVDYATNIAAGLDILADKWNQTRSAGLIHDNGNPAALENWVFAIWAYNSGFYPPRQPGDPGDGAWGVGWVNNPANPLWLTGRRPFLTYPSDAAHPQNWSYPEKVLGFAGNSIDTPDGPGFRAAWWVSDDSKRASQPSQYSFCSASNFCEPGANYGAQGPCSRSDYKCWWHEPASFHSCAQNLCGNELLRFNSTYPEQPDGANNPPACSTTGLPSNVRIVDDVSTAAPPISTGTRPCDLSITNRGTFSMTFPETSANTSPARIDLHQSGAGFGGHVWWTHTRKEPRAGVDLEMSGTWAFSDAVNGWARVMVHVPDYAAHTQQAKYLINTGTRTHVRYLGQRRRVNGWVSLGVFAMNAAPKITLASHTDDGRGDDDIAWDAAAVQPLPGKPRHVVVALGDSYISGEGASVSRTEGGKTDHGASYYKDSDYGGALEDTLGRNACHRSTLAWPRKMGLPGLSASAGSRADAWDPAVDLQLQACSGAKTQNVNDAGSPNNAFGRGPIGQYSEKSQLDKGYVDDATTLVLLSIGGNDAGFADVIKSCIVDPRGCDVAQSDLESRIRGPVRESILLTIKRIHIKAPQAKIMLMGYPEIVSAPCAGGEIGTTEVAFLADISRRVVPSVMAAVKADAASNNTSVTLGDPLDDFAGKGACGSPEHIRGVVNDTTEGDKPKILGLFPPSAQSFHPNPDGTGDYAAAATRAAAGMGL